MGAAPGGTLAGLVPPLPSLDAASVPRPEDEVATLATLDWQDTVTILARVQQGDAWRVGPYEALAAPGTLIDMERTACSLEVELRAFAAMGQAEVHGHFAVVDVKAEIAVAACVIADHVAVLLDDGAGYVRWKEGEGEGPEVIHAEAL